MSPFDAAYAAVWDAIYGEPEFVAAQIAFLETVLAGAAEPWLDVGCGTGRHLLPLRAAARSETGSSGHAAVGLDLSGAMLAVARARLAEAGQAPALVWGDIAAAPFAAAFGAVVCLDSLLPMLTGEADLAAALAAMRRVLRPDGLLVVEIYDFPGSLGEEPLLWPYTSRFRTAWGRVFVRETHSYDRATGLWRMTQELTVLRDATQEQFTVEHLLRIRTADTYAAALEAAGFTILQLFPCYPNAPDHADEQRMIFVAQAK